MDADQISKTLQLGMDAASSLKGALDAARPRRFASRVPSPLAVAVFEELAKVKKHRGATIMIGRPVHAVDTVQMPEGGDGRKVKKQIRRLAREADSWLGKDNNKGLGGNREAMCEFVLVKRSRKASGKVIGVVRRCFVAPREFESRQPQPSVAPPIQSDSSWWPE